MTLGNISHSNAYKNKKKQKSAILNTIQELKSVSGVAGWGAAEKHKNKNEFPLELKGFQLKTLTVSYS